MPRFIPLPQTSQALVFLGAAGAVFECFAQASVTAPVPGVSSGTFLQGFIGLLVVIGLLFLVLFALRRFGGRLTGASTTGLKVISGISVGTRERILLVEVADTWLVVGVTSSQVRTLHTLPKQGGGDPDGCTSSSSSAPFSAWLNQVVERKRHDT